MRVCRERLLLVSLVWAWVFIGSIVLLALISYIELGVFLKTRAIELLFSKPYLSVYIELIAIGALPAAF